MNKLSESRFNQIYYKYDDKGDCNSVSKQFVDLAFVRTLFQGIKLAPHPHVHWLTFNSNLRKSVIQVGDRTIGCYVADKREASFQMKILETTIKVVFESIMSTVQDFINSNPNQAVDLNVATAFARRAPEVYELWDKTKKIMPKAENVIRKLEKNYGIPFSEQCDIVTKMLADLQNVLKGMRAIVKKDTIADVWKVWEKQIRTVIVRNREQFHVKVVTQEYVLSQEDCKFLNIKGKFSADKMSCFSFAFLTTREEQAIPLIKSFSDDEDLQKNYLSFLHKWGYELQEPPQKGQLILKPGDLVGYVCTSEEVDASSKPGLSHLAVLQSSGEALSKMGWTESAISLHRLSDIPGQFGRNILIFRKKTNS